MLLSVRGTDCQVRPLRVFDGFQCALNFIISGANMKTGTCNLFYWGTSRIYECPDIKSLAGGGLDDFPIYFNRIGHPTLMVTSWNKRLVIINLQLFIKLVCVCVCSVLHPPRG